MSLSSLQLDAFQAVIAERNFSKAAKQLKITQGALSQRIQKLEKELETTLLRRSASGVEPTDAGWKLAQYCQAKGRVEDEVIEELSGKRESQSLSGFLRIAGYSSVTRSVLQPSLAPLLREHPNLQIEFRTEPIEKLPQLLLQGEVDFLVLDHVFDKPGLETYVLGQETYVMIESSKYEERSTTYLDPRQDGTYTQSFLKRQGERLANVQRSFVGDVYGMIEGVQQGLGRGIVPRHLIKSEKGVREDQKWKCQKIPVVLHFWAQPYLSGSFQAVVDQLSRSAGNYLSSSSF